MGARVYDSRTGRFLQRDPIGIAGGVNLYAYVENDPVDRIDPTGLAGVFDPFWYQSPFVQAFRQALIRKIIAAWEIQGQYTGLLHSPNLLGWESTRSLKQMLRGIRTENRLLQSQTFRARALQAGRSVLSAARTGLGHVGRGIAYAGRGITYAGRILINPYTASLAVGVAIGTGLRYIEGVDEGAQLTWIQINDWLGGWLFGTQPAALGESQIVSSFDPNDILGPAGYGSARWVGPEQTLAYKIRFENDPEASAPAQVVRVVQQLDPDLDYATFELVSFGFGDRVVAIPAGRTFHSERLDLRETHGLYLDFVANLDPATGLVTWEMSSIDPVTGRAPRDPFSGFLPPNTTSPIGEGFVSYVVRARAEGAVGTPIRAQATIYFDTNEPIDTNVHVNPIGPIADCTGDCNTNGEVTVDELIRGVNIALGNKPVDDCPAFDRSGDGQVTINELVAAVGNALTGCPAASFAVFESARRLPPPPPSATPTPTPSCSPTPTMTP
jgi:hypothetical protein